jgi:hypothetical protein
MKCPHAWYNIQADLPEPLPPPLDPTTLKPIDPKLLERIFAKELIRQEVSTERYIKIPEEVLDAYLRLPRPTPLYRARRLEKFLKTPAKIYFKCENFSPTGKPQDEHCHSPSLLQQGARHKKACNRDRRRTVGHSPSLCMHNFRFEMPHIHGSRELSAEARQKNHSPSYMALKCFPRPATRQTLEENS